MIKDLVLKNRSYRGFDRSTRLSREDLMELVDLSRLSPSSMNRQALKFHIASDEDEVEKIQALTGWARRLPELNLPYPGTEPTAFIVICIDNSLGTKAAFQRDVGLCAEVMLLCAVEKGFGGCMLGTFKKGELVELLQLVGAELRGEERDRQHDERTGTEGHQGGEDCQRQFSHCVFHFIPPPAGSRPCRSARRRAARPRKA